MFSRKAARKAPTLMTTVSQGKSIHINTLKLKMVDSVDSSETNVLLSTKICVMFISNDLVVLVYNIKCFMSTFTCICYKHCQLFSEVNRLMLFDMIYMCDLKTNSKT